jgi:integrase
MAKAIHKLTALQVARATSGKLGDGGGLWLHAYNAGSKAWVFRFGPQGKRAHGLGSLNTVSLSAAREKARACREMLLAGIDPIAVRATRKSEARVATAKTLAFADCADQYHATHRAAWKSAKHAREWRASLAAYAGPVIGRLPVADIDTALVLKVLEPLWGVKLVTAKRIRQRIETVWDWAKVRGYCSGDNPARWSGHLDQLLAAPGKIRTVAHLAAMPYAGVPSFLVALRGREGVAPRALEFAVLTAARSSEVLRATWSEVDLAGKTWTVPAGRMKAGREHRVPLSPDAVALLRALPRVAGNEHVFPGARRSQGLGHVSLFDVLRTMGRGDVTVHGFRSSFRDWAAEQTGYPREICEAALAHVVGNQVEAAYRRSDLFEKRRHLMNDWARFCARPADKSGDVVPMRGGRRG